MSVKTLQQDIKQKEGLVISTDTLRLEDLLVSSYEIIYSYNLKTSIKKKIEEIFRNTDPEDTKNGIKALPVSKNLFYGNIELISEKLEEANYLWHEDIFNYFNNISPKKYYFGCSEGDGACIGFFLCNENY